MPDFGAYHYKARAYHPGLGRFMQTDPIGYMGGANLYGYVGGDPINRVDPNGLIWKYYTTCETFIREDFRGEYVSVECKKNWWYDTGLGSNFSGGDDLVPADFGGYRDLEDLRLHSYPTRFHSNRCQIAIYGQAVEMTGDILEDAGVSLLALSLITAEIPITAPLSPYLAAFGTGGLTIGGATSLAGSGVRALTGDYNSLAGNIVADALPGPREPIRRFVQDSFVSDGFKNALPAPPSFCED